MTPLLVDSLTLKARIYFSVSQGLQNQFVTRQSFRKCVTVLIYSQGGVSKPGPWEEVWGGWMVMEATVGNMATPTETYSLHYTEFLRTT